MDVSAKLAYRGGLTIETLLATRFLAAGALAWIAVAAMRLRPLPGPSRAIRVILLGAVAYAGESLMLNEALFRMPVSTVILIFYVYPALVALLAVAIGREKMGIAKSGAVGLGILGVAVLLSFPVHGMTPAGVVFALGAAASFAAYVVIAERMVSGLHPLAFSGLVMFGAGTTIAVLGIAKGTFPVGLDTSAGAWVIAHTILVCVALTAFIGAMRRLGATGASIGNTIEPAIAVILSVIVLDEHFGGLQFVGAGLLLLAIVLLPLFRSNEPPLAAERMAARPVESRDR
jgi:drug/metabolite transporter (DMT)-like permease